VKTAIRGSGAQRALLHGLSRYVNFSHFEFDQPSTQIY
jgi:hypothetical protein